MVKSTIKNGADCMEYILLHSENKARTQAFSFVFYRGADCQA